MAGEIDRLIYLRYVSLDRMEKPPVRFKVESTLYVRYLRNRCDVFQNKIEEPNYWLSIQTNRIKMILFFFLPGHRDPLAEAVGGGRGRTRAHHPQTLERRVGLPQVRDSRVWSSLPRRTRSKPRKTRCLSVGKIGGKHFHTSRSQYGQGK